MQVHTGIEMEKKKGKKKKGKRKKIKQRGQKYLIAARDARRIRSLSVLGRRFFLLPHRL